MIYFYSYFSPLSLCKAAIFSSLRSDDGKLFTEYSPPQILQISFGKASFWELIFWWHWFLSWPILIKSHGGNSQNAENNKSHGMANKTFLNTAQTNYFSQGSHHYSNVKGLLMLRSSSQCIPTKEIHKKNWKGAIGKERCGNIRRWGSH